MADGDTMKYEHIVKGTFQQRPNRFIAIVEVNGQIVKAHVKNTGRCRELLIPGAQIYLETHNNPARKTAFSLIGVQRGDLLINMDSQIPNSVAAEYILNSGCILDLKSLVREKTYGDSRFDLYYEAGHDHSRKGFIEVKGVTLERDGVALFPDAPTKRGGKHVYELMKAHRDGYEASLFFIIQMSGVRYFTPNTQTDPEFVQALVSAQSEGVRLRAFTCVVTPDTITLEKEIPVKLF